MAISGRARRRWSRVSAWRSAGGTVLRHIDLYRLESLDELEALGFEELISDDHAIALIEWPERAVGMLPKSYVLLELETAGPEQRRITVRPVDMGGRFGELGAVRFA
jgi:tRNA threonylcarbamoyl adenosine modification protein YjeE